MKKGWIKLKTVLLIALLVVGLVGCDGADLSESKYVDTWRTASVMGFDPAIVGMEIKITLEGDGTATVDTGGETAGGKWEETENGIIIKDNGDTMECVGDENRLETTLDDVAVVFERVSD